MLGFGGIKRFLLTAVGYNTHNNTHIHMKKDAWLLAVNARMHKDKKAKQKKNKQRKAMRRKRVAHIADRCNPETGYHSTPHKGCILR
jgi:hypothetical protein